MLHFPFHDLFAAVCQHEVNNVFLWDFILGAILKVFYLSTPYNVPDGLVANTAKYGLKVGECEQIRIVR